MRRATRALVVGALALGGAAAFLAGGQLEARMRTKPAPELGASGVAVASWYDRSAGAQATPPGSRPDVSRLGTALSTAMRSHAAESAPAQAYLETPDQRAERRSRIDRHLTDKLGTISPDKRAALLELNDEANQVQMSLQAQVLAGSLSQADYDAQIHQRIVVQLDQLRAVVTDDEYRKLTGLEPGVDPYEYMRTGIGAAPAAVPQ
jgi:hypothetical protein